MKMIKNRVVVKLSLLVLGALLSFSTLALSEKNQQAVAERIAPVGKVCLEGDSSCGGAVAAVSSGPKSADEIYNSSCNACHATGAAGAPKVGDVAAWSARIAQGNDVLYNHAIGGFNGMPPKGLCMSCSDDEIKLVVDFMVENSQ